MTTGLVLLFLAICQIDTHVPLAATSFQLARQGLEISPAKQAIIINPEGPPVVFQLTYAAPLDESMTLRGELIGPSLAAPLPVSSEATSQKLTISRDIFSQEGVYQLVSVRLEKAGQVLAMAEPQVAEIQVAEKFIVTQVEVEALSRQDLLDLGYSFNENDYFSVNFKIAVTVATKPESVNVTIPIAFPMVSNSTFAPQVLSDPFSEFTISPIMLPSEDRKKTRSEPEAEGRGATSPLIGLILIPGNFKYLKSHFGVTCILLNSAPSGFDVKVENLVAQLKLPLDPVISIQEPTTQIMINLGEDGQVGTADDRDSLFPGEEASARYIVTGEAPGIHELEIVIKGDLQLPQGRERLVTSARGTLYVRSPEFALSFEHPDRVEVNESYDLVVTISNRGQIALEDFSCTLDPDFLQGVVLDGSAPVQNIPAIAVGGEAVIVYRMKSLLTGKVLAGYYKQEGQPGSAQTPINLRMAVGNLGQRPSAYVLYFPEVFYQRFPSPLSENLRVFAKKALDVGLTADHELPSDLEPIAASAIRRFNRRMVWMAKGPDYGMTDQESLARLFSLWARGMDGNPALDKIRRKIINRLLEEPAGLDLETAFAQAFNNSFSGMDSVAFLSFLAQEHESVTDLSLFLFEASGSYELGIRDSQGRISQRKGRRDIPFSVLLPLSPTKTLIWCSDIGESPILEVVPAANQSLSVNLTAILPRDQGQGFQILNQTSAITDPTQWLWKPSLNQMLMQPTNGPPQSFAATGLAVKPFELISVHQVEPRLFEKADAYGRHQAFFFSKPLDLNSLEPLESHLSINGEPISFAELQQGGRLLIASAKMPLGPYHPIRYRLEGARSRAGQALGLEEGVYQGSADYTGVFFTGKIVDRNGTDVTKARAFLWLEDLYCPSPSTCREELRIVHSLNPDVDGRFQFDFAPLIPDLNSTPLNPTYQKLRMSVVLEDGRYEARDFRPLGPGQEIFAEFAFLQLGSVEGSVTTATGEPVAFQKVFVTSQENSLSAAITETDGLGRYRVDGIDVGPVLVKSAYQNRIALASNYLTQANSPLQIDLVISLPVGRLQGMVTVNDGNTVQALADTYIGYAVQGGQASSLSIEDDSYPFAVLTQTDANGSYTLDNAPAGNGLLWFYHPDHGFSQRNIFLPENATGTYHHQFDAEPLALSVLTGFVETQAGQRAAGARVLAGNFLTYTDANGAFRFDYLERNENLLLRAKHDSLGSGSFGIFLDQPEHHGITIVIYSGVPASGVYFDAAGNPIPFRPIFFAAKVPFPQVNPDFALFAQTEFDGRWQGRLPRTGKYTFSAYQPPRLIESQTVIVGATGVADLFLRQVPTADLIVKLVKTDGTPVVAKVNLSARVPSSDPKSLGVPLMQVVRSDAFTDAEGKVTFTAINTGSFAVFGHLNALGETEVFEGILDPQPVGGSTRMVTLVFPDPEVPANLFGNLTEADGTPAPAGTLITVKGPGVNQFALATPAGTYRFEDLGLGNDPTQLTLLARNPVTGHFASALLQVNQELNLRYDMVLARTGTAHIQAVRADGEPIDFADITVFFGRINAVGSESLGLQTVTSSQQVTPDTPIFTVAAIPSGRFVVRANAGNGFVGLRSLVMPRDGGDLNVTVMLEASSSIRGVFVNGDDPVNPVPIADAEIQLLRNQNLLQQKLTDNMPGSIGAFSFTDLPMRSYRLLGVDPATARKANLDVFTSPFNPHPQVTLALDPVAGLAGLVTYLGEPVPNVTLTFIHADFRLITGTDIHGRYQLSNLPLGDYAVRGVAQQIPSRLASQVKLRDPFVTQIQDLSFGETRTLDLLVEAPGGGPAPGVFVSAIRRISGIAAGNSGYTDENGHVLLAYLPVGRYVISTEDPSSLNSFYEVVSITQADPDPVQKTVRLTGWGTVSGYVSDSLGEPLERPVTLQFETYFLGQFWERAITTGSDGYYRIGNVPQGVEVRLTAFRPETGEVAHEKVTITQHLEEVDLALVFAATTDVSGRVTFSDGSPAAFVRVKTDRPIEHGTLTDPDGYYTLRPVLDGDNLIVATDTQSARQGARLLALVPINGSLNPVTDFDIQLSGVAQVNGMVTYADGEPVRLGRVTLAVATSNLQLTAPIQGDGSYVFTQVPLGEYTLTAHDNGLDYASASFTVTAVTDGQILNQDLVFEQDFSLSGLVYAPNRVDPEPASYVSLWRRRASSSVYDRIYAAQADINGNYQLVRVFPGEYLLKATSEDVTATFQANFLMPNANLTQAIYLQAQTWLDGALTDASGKPFGGGLITLTQGGIPRRISLPSDGAFRFNDLSAGAYLIQYSVSGHWYAGQVTGVLQPGANTLLIATPENTLTLSGRAILAKQGTLAKPRVTLRKGNIQKYLNVAADGRFSIQEVPEGETLTLELRYQSAFRTWQIGPFAAPVGVDPVDAGTFYLDAIKPQVSLVDEGVSVTAMPHTIQWNLVEPDPQSAVDPARTRVWVNGSNITAFFSTNQTQVRGVFDYLPEGFVPGDNNLKIRVYNTSNTYQQQNFNLNLALAGTTLRIQLLEDSLPVVGQVRLDGATWFPADANGEVIVQNLAPGIVRFAARGVDKALRGLLEVGAVATQNIVWNLEEYGEYRGTVLDIDGQPAVGAVVAKDQDFVTTNATGQYIFDYLPLGRHEIQVDFENKFAFTKGPNLHLPKQVKLGVDLQLYGRGELIGTVFDGDGVTPAAAIAVKLSYSDLPSGYDLSTTSAADGTYAFTNILTIPINLKATEPNTNRRGYASGQIANPGDTLVLDLTLAPTATLVGDLNGLDGQPLADWPLEVRGILAGTTGIVIQASTDAAGHFEIPDLVFGRYRLEVNHQPSLAYLGTGLTVANLIEDLGELQLVMDLPPAVVGNDIPPLYDPRVTSVITLDFKDDRKLASYRFSLSGAFNFEERADLSGGRNRRVFVRPKIPNNTPPGDLFYRAEVTDHFGQLSFEEGTVQLALDTIGPVVSILQPSEQITVPEGAALVLEAAASDYSGVTRVDFFINDLPVGSDNLPLFKLTAQVPAVQQMMVVDVRAVAYDRWGNATSAVQPIEIQPIQTSGSPIVTLLGPLPDQPLPLWLASGLQLKIGFNAADPDSLSGFKVLLNGVVIFDEVLNLPSVSISRSYLLPESLRSATTLDFRLEVYDLGGNTTLRLVTIQKLLGDWLVKTAADPLNWPIFYIPTAAERHLILTSGEHIIDGGHQLDGLVLVNGAVLTQTESTAGDTFVAHTRLDLTERLVIDFGSEINVSGKGYRRMPVAMNLANEFSGHAHAGLGRYSQDYDEIYGSPVMPLTAGSRRGGGAVKLKAPELWLAGDIHADGLAVSLSGSGGSIWLEAPIIHGFGMVTANGWSGVFEDKYNGTGGGGGRVAIWAAFAGTAQAQGGSRGGAGSVYTRLLDANAPRGYRDQLTISNHPDATYAITTAKKTALLSLRNLEVGVDVFTSLAVIDNQTRQILEVINPAILPVGAYLGAWVYLDGDQANGHEIQYQIGNALQYDDNRPGPTVDFSNGQVIHIAFQIDELIVGDRAWMDFRGIQPDSPVSLKGGRSHSGNQAITVQNITLEAGDAVEMTGMFNTTQVRINGGALYLNGELNAQLVNIALDATLGTPKRRRKAKMKVTADVIRVDGRIIAQTNGLVYTNERKSAHGGIGVSGGASYGTPYAPETSGSSHRSDDFAGGAIHLLFDSLQVSGELSATGKRGAGGSIWLEGQLIAGSGRILANGTDFVIGGGGGGRIALAVEDLSGFTGTLQAYSPSDFDNRTHQGAGTIFYRNSQWPLGRLVIDNLGGKNYPRSTPLPALGERVVSVASGGNQLVLAGLPKFNDLAGEYVRFQGGETIAISANDSTNLYTEGVFPNVLPGEVIRGVHRLNVLEIRGNAYLYSLDPIEVTDAFVVSNGKVEAPLTLPTNSPTFLDGRMDLYSDLGLQDVILDNFELVAHVPLNINQVTLKNGAKLVIGATMTVGDLVAETGTTIEAAILGNATALMVGNLHLQSGATFTVADRISNSKFFPLRIQASGTVMIDAGAVVSTSGRFKVVGAALQWAGSSYKSNAHAGMGRVTSPELQKPMGSFAEPSLPGNNEGGGVIKIIASQLVHNGLIRADGYGGGTGGSIWIDAAQISGSGSVSAQSSTGTRGNGRIAVYYDSDRNFADTMTFLLVKPGNTQYTSQGGAGTLFLKSSTQQFGELIIDQNNIGDSTLSDMEKSFRLTAVTGINQITLNLDDDDPDPTVIRDLSWTSLPPGLAGVYAAFTVDGTDYQLRIAGNTHNEIQVAGSGPAILPAGTQIKFRLLLDRLILRNQAQFYFPGDIQANEWVFEGPDLLSVFASNVIGLPNPLVINNQRLRFILDEPRLQDMDLQLNKGRIFFDKPVVLRDISLANGSWIHHSRRDRFYALLDPILDITARDLVIDGTSSISVSNRIYFSPGRYGHGSPSPTRSGARTYGSLFQPQTYGSGSRGGGKLKLKANSLQGGSLRALELGESSGGSLWIDISTISGNVFLKASSTGTLAGGGRIALYYDDISAATIEATAFGKGAAGTIFTQQNGVAYGDLKVVSNDPGNGPYLNPIPTIPVTSLPVDFSLIYDAASDASILRVPGLALSENFTGYYLAINGLTDSLYEVLASRNESGIAEFTLQGALPPLVVGDTIQLALRLASLQVSADTTLGPDSLLIVADQVITKTTAKTVSKTQPRQPEIWANAPAGESLEIDGQWIQVQTAIDYERLILRNGAQLEVLGSIHAGDMVLIDSQLSLTANQSSISADSLTLRNASLIVDQIAVKGTLDVDARSRITTATVLTSDDGTTLHPNAGLSHGGLGSFHLENERILENPTHGSLFWPLTPKVPGPLYAGLDLQAGVLNLAGKIEVPGGAILIRVHTLRGPRSALIDASASLACESCPAMGGGRIAVYYQQMDAWSGRLQAFGFDGHAGLQDAQPYSRTSGAGTIYLRGAHQRFGELRVINHGAETIEASTPLASFGEWRLSLPHPGGSQLELADAGLPLGLAGLYLRIHGGKQPRDILILANTQTAITLAKPIGPLVKDTRLTASLHLDRLVLGGAANLRSQDTLVMHGPIDFGTDAQAPATLWVRAIEGLHSPWRIQNQHGGLVLDQAHPHLQMVLDHASMRFDQPLQIAALTLVNESVVSHKARRAARFQKYPKPPAVILTLHDLAIDETSAINVAASGYLRRDAIEEMWHGRADAGQGHGGEADFMGEAYPYGSAFWPDTHGFYLDDPAASGAGRIHLKAQNIQVAGEIAASDVVGGSILIETERISGSGLIHASGQTYRGTCGTAGRIAIYALENDLTHTPQAHSPEVAKQLGAGTVYLRQKNQAMGTLILRNPEASEQAAILATPVWAIGRHQLTSRPSNIRSIHQPGAHWRYSVKGMQVVDAKTGVFYTVIDQAHDQLFLDRAIEPAPSAGWSYYGRLPVNRLILQNAKLTTVDVLHLENLTSSGGQVNGEIQIDGGVWIQQQLRVDRLTVHGDLQLRESQLHTAAIQAEHLHLTRGSVIASIATHEGRLTLNLTGKLRIDADSAIHLDGVGQMGSEFTSHGGLATGATITDLYDSPVIPIWPGGGDAGGGALKVRANEIHLNGEMSARGQGFSSGGAIWLITDAFIGTGLLDVSGGSKGDQYGGGGRIAVHTPDRRLFSGQVRTGLDPGSAGSLVWMSPAQGFLRVAQTFPSDHPQEESLGLGLAPTMLLPQSAIRQIQENTIGTLLHVQTQMRLGDADAMWLSFAEGDRQVRIHSFGAGRYLVQLPDKLDLAELEALQFFIKVASDQKVHALPGSIFIKVVTP